MTMTAAELAAALSAPGLIREDVIDEVQNLDEGIPTTLTNLVGSDSFDAKYSEWTEDNLEEPALANAIVDGADATGNDTSLGNRVGNRSQISDKKVNISHSSQAVNSIGNVGTMAYQIAKRLMELRRRVETTACARQGSQVDDGSVTPGRTASLAAWIKTNATFGVGGSAGGFDLNTKVVNAPTAGALRALTWEGVRNRIEGVYNGGGFPSTLMTVPSIIKRINSFLFSDAGKPYRAEPTANVTGQGGGATQTAQGFISVVLSDFGISLNLVDNRLQLPYDSDAGTPGDVADVFIIDPRYFRLSYLFGYRQDELGKPGHSDKRLLSTEWMTKCMREDAHGLLADIDITGAVTAGNPTD